MSASDPSRTHEEAPEPPPAAVFFWGVGILIFGLVAAVLIYVFAGEDTDSAAALARGKMYEHNIQLMGGKFALYSVRFVEWFGSLWHGRTLAWTIGVLAIVIAGACFLIDHLLSMPLPREVRLPHRRFSRGRTLQPQRSERTGSFRSRGKN
jgi:hypothetical protein